MWPWWMRIPLEMKKMKKMLVTDLLMDRQPWMSCWQWEKELRGNVEENMGRGLDEWWMRIRWWFWGFEVRKICAKRPNIESSARGVGFLQGCRSKGFETEKGEKVRGFSGFNAPLILHEGAICSRSILSSYLYSSPFNKIPLFFPLFPCILFVVQGVFFTGTLVKVKVRKT